MAEIKNGSGVGQIQIADDVIAVIAGTAAVEVEGVISTGGHIGGGISDMIGRKNLSKGVKVEVLESNVNITISLMLKFGHKLQDVSKNVQQRVKNAVETMTGLNVLEVNILISGIIVENKKDQKSNE